MREFIQSVSQGFSYAAINFSISYPRLAARYPFERFSKYDNEMLDVLEEREKDNDLFYPNWLDICVKTIGYGCYAMLGILFGGMAIFAISKMLFQY